MSGEPTPRCWHFPLYELPYFEGLTAEVRLTKDDGTVVWEKRKPRNEPLDLAVGNRSMAALYGMDRNMHNESWWQALEAMVQPLAQSPASVPAPPTVLSPAPVGSTPPQPSAPPSPQPPAPIQNPSARPVRAVRGRFV